MHKASIQHAPISQTHAHEGWLALACQLMDLQPRSDSIRSLVSWRRPFSSHIIRDESFQTCHVISGLITPCPTGSRDATTWSACVTLLQHMQLATVHTARYINRQTHSIALREGRKSAYAATDASNRRKLQYNLQSRPRSSSKCSVDRLSLDTVFTSGVLLYVQYSVQFVLALILMLSTCGCPILM